MRVLQFSVSGQKLSTAGDHSGLIAGTRGYLQTAPTLTARAIRLCIMARHGLARQMGMSGNRVCMAGKRRR